MFFQDLIAERINLTLKDDFKPGLFESQIEAADPRKK
jgi:hypothetical protein